MSELKDILLGALMGLTRAIEGNEDLVTPETRDLIAEGLRSAAPEREISADALQELVDRVHREKFRIVPSCEFCASPCGNTSDYDMARLYAAPAEVRRVKEELLGGLFALAEHPAPDAAAFFCQVLSNLTYDMEAEDFSFLVQRMEKQKKDLP